MRHVSLDLETMGNAPYSAIVAIGAVKFDPLTGELGSTCYLQIDLVSAVKHGGMIEASTVLWWMQQSDAARKEVTGATRLMNLALHEFAQWLPRDAFVWGNGCGFDNARLREAYQNAAIPCPFSYRNDMDLRTAKEIVRLLGDPSRCEVEQAGTVHNALDDAVHQAQRISVYVRELRRIKGESE